VISPFASRPVIFCPKYCPPHALNLVNILCDNFVNLCTNTASRLRSAPPLLVLLPAESNLAIMEAIQTHPGNANQAKNFMSPGSLSFPTGHNELTPPGDAGLKAPANGAPAGSPLANGNGVAPATPAATPGAQQTGSGLTPTLQ
jgi:hypothetical protein